MLCCARAGKVEAEHAAALLMLHQVDGSRQYERKLPEPFRTAWLKLCGRADPLEGGKGAAAAPEFVCEECGKGFKKEHGQPRLPHTQTGRTPHAVRTTREPRRTHQRQGVMRRVSQGRRCTLRTRPCGV